MPDAVGLAPAGYPAVTVTGSLANLLLFVPGDPVAKGRPRTRVGVGANGKAFAQVFTPAETRSYEDWVAGQCMEQLTRLSIEASMRGEQWTLPLPLKGRLVVTFRFNVTRPASLAKRVQFPLTKPDIDNLDKSVLDALQKGGVVARDQLVTDLSCMKRFVEPGHPLGVEIDLTGWLV